MKCFYHIDEDGKCAAFWVNKLARHYDGYEKEFIPINYGIDFPFDIIHHDEQIYIDLEKVPANIAKIAIAITIFEADSRRQNFGMVHNAFARVVDNDTGKEMIHFDLGEDFSTETAIIAVEFYRHNGSWKMSAVAQGYSGGLAALARSYGLNVG